MCWSIIRVLRADDISARARGPEKLAKELRPLNLGFSISCPVIYQPLTADTFLAGRPVSGFIFSLHFSCF